MEMPEGWNRLNGNANEVSSEFFDFSGKDYKIACEIEAALELLREMAEALDEILKYELQMKYQKERQTLKKFKEWK